MEEILLEIIESKKSVITKIKNEMIGYRIVYNHRMTFDIYYDHINIDNKYAFSVPTKIFSKAELVFKQQKSDKLENVIIDYINTNINE